MQALENLRKLLFQGGDDKDIKPVELILEAWNKIIDLANTPVEAMMNDKIKEYERDLIGALNEIGADQDIIASMRRSLDKKKELYEEAEKEIMGIIMSSDELENNDELNKKLDEALIKLNKNLHAIPVLQDVKIEKK